jgi:adhesin transport system membrane fusion protein
MASPSTLYERIRASLERPAPGGAQGGEPAPRAAKLVITAVGVLLLSLGLWAGLTQLEEVTRGSGRVIPSSRVQVIQTPEAGVVREIPIRLGQRIHKGELLMRLEDTPNATRANEVEAQARAIRAQIARLEIESSGLEDPYQCPVSVAEVAPAVCANEQSLLALRRENLNTRLDVFRHRVHQRRQEIAETNAGMTRFSDGLKLAEREMRLVGPMATRNLVSQMELLRVERQLVDYKGQVATATETLSKLQSALSEAELQVEEQVIQFRREAAGELTTRKSELSVIDQTLRGAEVRVARTDIRAPVDGIINSLPVTTVGAFLNAGERVVEIVPLEDKLLVETRIRPSDIAFVTNNQRAIVKVTAYDFFQYGGLNGTVEHVSADSLFDSNAKENFYAVIIRTDEATLKRGNVEYPIIPGMITDVDIITGRKSILTYLMKPINRAWREALRER